MARKVDREVLIGFIAEARGYLPQIVEGINRFRGAPDQVEAIEEAFRHAHCIKGASSMVGLSGLSHIAYHLEQALEDISLGQLPMTEEAVALLLRTVSWIE